MTAIDELRAMAESVGLAMPQAATLMMGAADAIDRLDVENARLRSELEYVGTVSYLYGRGDLKAENTKLHELLAGDETQRRIAAIGEGTVPTYHGTDTVDEARLVVENAKLREYVTKLEQESIVLSSNNCDLLNDMAPMQEQNARLRKLVQRMWPAFTGEKRATFADRLHVRAEIDELGIEVE